MSMIIRKRQLLMATLAVALGAAVFVNWYYTRAQTSPADVSTSVTSEVTQDGAALGDSLYVHGTTTAEQSTETSVATAGSVAEYFADARLNRSKAHDKVLEAIEEIIENDEATSEEKNKATMYLNDFQAAVKLEADIENLITAKTGSACLVTINNGKAVVVIEPDVLDGTISLQISEIVKQQADISSENISIIEAK